MFEFARRVHRIDVDHHIASAQQAEQADRILQQIGHHQGDATTLGQAQPALKIASNLATGKVKRMVTKRYSGRAADKSLALAKLGHSRIEIIGNRPQGFDVDLGGNACRVTFRPDIFHFLFGAQGVDRSARWLIAIAIEDI